MDNKWNKKVLKKETTKFLKKRSEKNESEYKNYKKLFDSVKKRS